MKTWIVGVVALGLPILAQAYTIDKEVPEAVHTQLRADFAFLAGIQGEVSSGLHQQIFGPLDGENYVRFFESRVTEIGLYGCGSDIAVACVVPFFNASKMWITNNYIKFSHPQIARLMVVFHEARHTETQHGFWSHAVCPRPFLDEADHEIRSIWTGAALAGESACDRTPFGSYGSSMIMLKNIQKFCSNCSEKVQMDAGLYADDQFKRVTDAAAQQAIRQDLYP